MLARSLSDNVVETTAPTGSNAMEIIDTEEAAFSENGAEKE